MPAKTWHDHHAHPVPSRTIDRRQAEHGGPPVPCCARQLVAADMLVHVPDAILERVQAAMPHLIGAGPHYVCCGCRAKLERLGIVAEAEWHQ